MIKCKFPTCELEPDKICKGIHMNTFGGDHICYCDCHKIDWKEVSQKLLEIVK